MPHILNDPVDYVSEFVAGLVRAHPRVLRLSERAPRVVVRADRPEPGRVAIVSGGGAGHLPTFVGYVGPGLLDGCAVGNLFASPSAEQFLAAAQDTDSGAGVLFLYGNYTGDRLNVGLAIEEARALGHAVAEVRACDDVASAPAERAGERRGIAGLMFAIKAAGAAAAGGAALPEVAAVAADTLARTRSVGVALGACELPTVGQPTFKVSPGTMEVGMGIHGEPGVRTAPLAPADVIVGELVDRLLADLCPRPAARLAVLVNGLGATPGEELYLLYRRVDECLTEKGHPVHRAFVGEYTTSLEMPGFSISLVELDDDLAGYLAADGHSPVLRLL